MTGSSAGPNKKAPVGAEAVDRRDFLWEALKASLGVPIALGVVRVPELCGMQEESDAQAERVYGMGIDVRKCIGCGRCAQACKNENDVPDEPYFFNTWVARCRARRARAASAVMARSWSIARTEESTAFRVTKNRVAHSARSSFPSCATIVRKRRASRSVRSEPRS